MNGWKQVRVRPAGGGGKVVTVKPALDDRDEPSAPTPPNPVGTPPPAAAPKEQPVSVLPKPELVVCPGCSGTGRVLRVVSSGSIGGVWTSDSTGPRPYACAPAVRHAWQRCPSCAGCGWVLPALLPGLPGPGLVAPLWPAPFQPAPFRPAPLVFPVDRPLGPGRFGPGLPGPITTC